jgi:hypothetical protein
MTIVQDWLLIKKTLRAQSCHSNSDPSGMKQWNPHQIHQKNPRQIKTCTIYYLEGISANTWWPSSLSTSTPTPGAMEVISGDGGCCPAMNDADQSTQNYRRGSSKGHWVCTCMTDNLWKGSKLVSIRARVAHLLGAHRKRAAGVQRWWREAATTWRQRRVHRLRGSSAGQGGTRRPHTLWGLGRRPTCKVPV